MHFVEVRRSGDVVLQVEDLAKSYDRPLFSHLSFQLQRGKKLGIMGPNGSGKTTLLRILLGEENPDAGAVHRGHAVEFGYYDQQLQTLPDDRPVIHGNYDTYTLMRGRQRTAESAHGKVEESRKNAAVANAAPARQKQKRRFPYRKVADLEADISANETRLRELEELLASTHIY